jgi:hypothetical protein
MGAVSHELAKVYIIGVYLSPPTDFVYMRPSWKQLADLEYGPPPPKEERSRPRSLT